MIESQSRQTEQAIKDEFFKSRFELVYDVKTEFIEIANSALQAEEQKGEIINQQDSANLVVLKTRPECFNYDRIDKTPFDRKTMTK